MGLMMWFMMRSNKSQTADSATALTPATSAVVADDRLAGLRVLLMGRGMAGGQCSTPSATTTQAAPTIQSVGLRLTRDEQLAELKAQLTILEVRQQAIAREIADLEPADGVAVREAEAIARAADE